MIYYRCSHCGRRVEKGKKCGCNFKREYTAPTGTRKLYHTGRWTKLQRTIMQRYNGLDLYALNVHKRMEYAEVVHHILPAEEHPDQFWNPDNLIPLSRHSHDEVHEAYRVGPQEATRLQQQLALLVRSNVSVL